jgi:putative hydrolase of the HAD superfamily
MRASRGAARAVARDIARLVVARRHSMARATPRAARAVDARPRARATRRASTARGSNFDALVFDLDGVLYDGANGYLAHVRARQRAYLRERFGMTAAEAAATRKTAFAKASQCYKGLRDLGLDVESQEAFTAYCRAGAETFLKPDAALAECLRAMPYRKVVMTNTSETEGMKALTALGLDASSSDAFEKVYGGIFTAPACKPQREAFEKVFADLGRDVDPRRCVMFEDSMKNVKAAKSFGMTTVFVRTRGESVLDDDVEACCDAVVDEIEFEQLRRQLPELFD